MKYEISVKYERGSSMGPTETLIDEIPHVWEDPRAVEESLRRLKKHYDWRKKKKSRVKDTPEKPDFVGPKGKYNHDIRRPEDYVKIVTDEGEEKAIRPFYLGYHKNPRWMEIRVKDSREWV